jgi:hypothetical protein
MSPKELAEAHWYNYIRELLRVHNVPEDTLKIVEFHYIMTFVHGYGHGYEQCQEDVKNGKNE